MKKLLPATLALVKASKGCPVMSTATILLFYVMFTLFEGQVEKLIFGDRFEHWLDPIFSAVFICYAAYTVAVCGAFNSATNDA